MVFKPISRTALTLSESRCAYLPLYPCLISRRTIIGPMGPPSSTRPPPSTQSSSPSSSPRRTGPPNNLSTYERSSSTPDRNVLVDHILSSTSTPHSSTSKSSKWKQAEAEVERRGQQIAIEKQQFRRWKAGDVYAPHDLSSIEMRKWSRKKAIQGDVFEMLDLDPRMEYKVRGPFLLEYWGDGGLQGGEGGRDNQSVTMEEKLRGFLLMKLASQNYSMMWEYVSKMGRIRHSRETGLGNVNQRRLAKAVRRSMGMGLLPTVHKHPEMLETEAIAKAKLMGQAGRKGGVFLGPYG